jgi:hypothetical protein
VKNIASVASIRSVGDAVESVAAISEQAGRLKEGVVRLVADLKQLDHRTQITINDPYLRVTRVSGEPSAMSNAVASALGRNKTYDDAVGSQQRAEFRSTFASILRSEAKAYVQSVSDNQHYAAIERISSEMSRSFVRALVGGRLRYGTSQKAFNLYLKFLWRLGQIPSPPHCPVDSIVLRNAGIAAAWTKSDSEAEYRGWIATLKSVAHPASLADWEYQVWLRGAGH